MAGAPDFTSNGQAGSDQHASQDSEDSELLTVSGFRDYLVLLLGRKVVLDKVLGELLEARHLSLLPRGSEDLTTDCSSIDVAMDERREETKAYVARGYKLTKCNQRDRTEL